MAFLGIAAQSSTLDVIITLKNNEVIDNPPAGLA